MIFEAIHDTFHLVLDKAAIEFFDAVEVAGIGEEYGDAVVGYGIASMWYFIMYSIYLRGLSYIVLLRRNKSLCKKIKKDIEKEIIEYELDEDESLYKIPVEDAEYIYIFAKNVPCVYQQ